MTNQGNFETCNHSNGIKAVHSESLFQSDTNPYFTPLSQDGLASSSIGIPTFLKLDINDFIESLELLENNQQPSQTTQSPTTPLFKCKWLKTVSTQPVTDVRCGSVSPSSGNSSSPKESPKPIRNNNQSLTNTPKKVQKRRNYQQVFHTIPPRNSCSEKKTGGWKFHLMDSEEDQDQSAYKFHFYSGISTRK